MITKKGQVWIETVLYTIMGITLLGLVLALVVPKINEAKDRVVVEQAIESLNKIDEKFSIEIGNVRDAEFMMKRGDLFIDSVRDRIYLVINDLSKPYSEPNVSIKLGRVEIVSQSGQKKSSINITLDYTKKFNLTYAGKDENKKFTTSPTPYRFLISNKGIANGKYQLDIEEISGR